MDFPFPPSKSKTILFLLLPLPCVILKFEALKHSKVH